MLPGTSSTTGYGCIPLFIIAVTFNDYMMHFMVLWSYIFDHFQMLRINKGHSIHPEVCDAVMYASDTALGSGLWLWRRRRSYSFGRIGVMACWCCVDMSSLNTYCLPFISPSLQTAGNRSILGFMCYIFFFALLNNCRPVLRCIYSVKGTSHL